MATSSLKFLERQKEPSLDVRVQAGFMRYSSFNWTCKVRMSILPTEAWNHQTFEVALEPDEADRLASQLTEYANMVRKDRQSHKE